MLTTEKKEENPSLVTKYPIYGLGIQITDFLNYFIMLSLKKTLKLYDD